MSAEMSEFGVKDLVLTQSQPIEISDVVKFVMCSLVSRDCIPFCKYVKRHV